MLKFGLLPIILIFVYDTSMCARLVKEVPSSLVGVLYSADLDNDVELV
jgi:hypothetical protein